LSFCTVTDFSAAERAWGLKFCTRVGLLSGQVFSPFGEIWPRGGSPISVYAEVTWENKSYLGRNNCSEARWLPWLSRTFGISGAACSDTPQGIRNWARASAGILNCVRLKPVWWDFRLADGLVTPPYGIMDLIYCVFVCFLYGYRFLSGGKR